MDRQCPILLQLPLPRLRNWCRRRDRNHDQVYRGAHGMAGEFGWMVIDALPSTGNSEEVSINRKAAVVDGLVRSTIKKAVSWQDFKRRQMLEKFFSAHRWEKH